MAGICAFYHVVCRKYLDIQINNVGEFVKRQKVYQLSRNTRHILIKPVLADLPNMRWAIDLIGMQRYSDKN